VAAWYICAHRKKGGGGLDHVVPGEVLRRGADGDSRLVNLGLTQKVCGCVYIYTHTHTHFYLSIYLSISIYISIYLSNYLSIHIYTYIYTHNKNIENNYIYIHIHMVCAYRKKRGSRLNHVVPRKVFRCGADRDSRLVNLEPFAGPL